MIEAIKQNWTYLTVVFTLKMIENIKIKKDFLQFTHHQLRKTLKDHRNLPSLLDSLILSKFNLISRLAFSD